VGADRLQPRARAAAVGGARLARCGPRGAFAAPSVAFALASLASLACAAAPSLGVLIAARAAQGIAGAMVVAAALELLMRSLRARAPSRCGRPRACSAARSARRSAAR
jgi:MFS family permease